MAASSESFPSPDDAAAVAALRCLAVELPTKAKSGHPGAPLGCAPMAYTIFRNHLRFNPANPKWIARDRFVLSNGHASALLYAPKLSLFFFFIFSFSFHTHFFFVVEDICYYIYLFI